MPARPYPIQIPPSTNGWSGYLITKGLCSADSNIDRKFKQHFQTHLEPRQKQQQRHIHIHHHQTPHQKKRISHSSNPPAAISPNSPTTPRTSSSGADPISANPSSTVVVQVVYKSLSTCPAPSSSRGQTLPKKSKMFCKRIFLQRRKCGIGRRLEFCRLRVR